MTITQAFLTSEISTLWPDNSIGEVTPANARTTLNDIVTAIFQGISSTGLSTANTWTALQTFSSGITISGALQLNGSSSGSVTLATPAASGGLLQFSSSGSFAATGGGNTPALGTLPSGPAAAQAKWLKIVDSGGATSYIPMWQ